MDETERPKPPRRRKPPVEPADAATPGGAESPKARQRRTAASSRAEATPAQPAPVAPAQRTPMDVSIKLSRSAIARCKRTWLATKCSSSSRIAWISGPYAPSCSALDSIESSACAPAALPECCADPGDSSVGSPVGSRDGRSTRAVTSFIRCKRPRTQDLSVMALAPTVNSDKQRPASPTGRQREDDALAARRAGHSALCVPGSVPTPAAAHRRPRRAASMRAARAR